MSHDPIILIARLEKERHRLSRLVQAWDLAGVEARPTPGPFRSGAPRPSRSQAAIQISRIDAALRRFHEGCFGQCCRCGQPIDVDWMAADPAAPLCRTCHPQPSLPSSR